MAHDPLVVTPDARPRALDVLGDQITVLASGRQTGSFEVFHLSSPERGGSPPHNHQWDEGIYVLRGELVVSLDGAERTAGPGTLVVIPGGTEHWFRAGPGGAEMVSVTSHSGASAVFTELDHRAGAVPPS